MSTQLERKFARAQEAGDWFLSCLEEIQLEEDFQQVQLEKLIRDLSTIIQGVADIEYSVLGLVQMQEQERMERIVALEGELRRLKNAR